MNPRIAAVLVTVLGVCSALAPASAQATFPGRNGAIIVTLNDFQHHKHGDSNTVIRAVSPTGGKPRTLLNCLQYAGSCPGQVLRPDISSDGQTIAFSGVYVTDTETFQSQLVLMSTRSTKLTRVPFTTHDSTESDDYPAWFPGSSELAFAVRFATGPAGLFTENTHGGARHKVSACACSAATVSPRGATLLADRGRALWMMGTDGSQPHVFAADAQQGSWAPNARHIAFATRGARSDIVVEKASGGGRRIVVKTGTQPVFSPNGKLIAFERNVGDRRHGVTEILTVPVSGGKGTRVMSVPRATIGVGGFDWRALPR
jgi:Tol biopolymer transport system component